MFKYHTIFVITISNYAWIGVTGKFCTKSTRNRFILISFWHYFDSQLRMKRLTHIPKVEDILRNLNIIYIIKYLLNVKVATFKITQRSLRIIWQKHEVLSDYTEWTAETNSTESLTYIWSGGGNTHIYPILLHSWIYETVSKLTNLMF